MIGAIRTVEAVLGNGKKLPQDVELANRDIARKSLVAASEIEKGECFTERNLTMKRPGIGQSPMEFWGRIGGRAQRAYSLDELID